MPHLRFLNASVGFGGSCFQKAAGFSRGDASCLLCVGCVQGTGPPKMTGAKNGMKSNMSVTLKSELVHVEEGFLDLGKLESVVS